MNPTPVTKFVVHWEVAQAVVLGLRSQAFLRTGAQQPLRSAGVSWAQGRTLEPCVIIISQPRDRAGAEVLEASQ